MASDTLKPSLSFLTDAAHLLAATSPEISAHLMTRRNALLSSNGVAQPGSQRQRVCGRCCALLILGCRGELKPVRSVTKATQTREEKGQKRRVAKGKPGEAGPSKSRSKTRESESRERRRNSKWVIDCHHCGAFTHVTVPPAPPVPRQRQRGKEGEKKKKAIALPVSDTPATAVAVGPSATAGSASAPPRSTSTTANASSKKRAKSRKQGLQALLQQSQAQAQGSGVGRGLGLSLVDFMKK